MNFHIAQTVFEDTPLQGLKREFIEKRMSVEEIFEDTPLQGLKQAEQKAKLRAENI